MTTIQTDPSKPQRKAVVLLSGGLDSSTCAALAAKEYRPANVIGLQVDYGSKHNERERRAAREVAGYLGIELRTLNMDPTPFMGAGSTLMLDGADNPELTYVELAEKEGPSDTYVPFRNGNLLAQAAALALKLGAEAIYYGAHAEDAHNWAYPRV
jgi:7-cyano-7-deazaguanine synthase